MRTTTSASADAIEPATPTTSRAATGSPGKATRTQRLARPVAAPSGALAPGGEPAAAAPAAPEPGNDPFAIHLIAERGVAGGGGALPHRDAIQRSFGPAHDVSGIEAYVGSAAGESAAQIGAAAYATGSKVAFREAPDLFTAAHEAAHVVQQASGVHLSGGVGADGDVHEQHADAVAERVVRGESAADLLAGYGGGAATAGVQRMSAMRSAAVTAMDKIRAELGPANVAKSTVAGGVYEKHTGYTQATLENQWKSPKTKYDGIMAKKAKGETLDAKEQKYLDDWDNGKIDKVGHLTGCNAFTGNFGAADLHLDTNLGRFDLATFTGTSGQFVKSTPDKFPQQGDVVRPSDAFHVCVSYNAPQKDGDTWQVLEAGQGGQSVGYDALKFNTRSYDSSKVEGWVDIDKQAEHDDMQHLKGAWEVTRASDGATLRYEFSPGSVTKVNLGDPDEQCFGYWEPTPDKIVITWMPMDDVESWKLFEVKKKQGKTTDPDGAALTFKRKP